MVDSLVSPPRLIGEGQGCYVLAMFGLVSKLRLGNLLLLRSSASPSVKQGLHWTCIPKLELGNENLTALLPRGDFAE